MHLVSQDTGSVSGSWLVPRIFVAYSVVGVYIFNLEEIRLDLYCRLTQPLNKLLGRRGTIFFACIFCIFSCLAQAFSSSWKMMVGFRILLGLGIGPKSATIPIYASECAPANVRGALVMFWQFFTAFGIMMGYFTAAALRGVRDGINNNICPQPQSPPPKAPEALTPDVQEKLLALRCVSNGSIDARHFFRTFLPIRKT